MTEQDLLDQERTKKYTLRAHLQELYRRYHDPTERDSLIQLGYNATHDALVTTYLRNTMLDPSAEVPLRYLPELVIYFNEATIVVGTFTMLFHHDTILSEAKHLLVEEASIATQPDVHMLYCRTKAETLVTLGDRNQLQPYRSRDLREFPRHNIISIADQLVEYRPNLTNVKLRYVYRSHPAIVEAISDAAYEYPEGAM